jgi:hypothetical protein
MSVTVSQSFKVSIRTLTNGNELFIIDIDQIDANLKSCIDAKFVKICEGNSGSNLSLVKTRLISFLTPKKGSNVEVGAIAEFFIHLYLNETGFEPQFLYLNLEEGSIKKGFDGYYLFNGEEWILESKSGSITTTGINHPGKIKEAYEDLKDKLSGGGTNNPWRNAYNHASQIDVGASPNVRVNIKNFSDRYDQLSYESIDNFNIIPGSTIFLDGTWAAADQNALETAINTLIVKLNYKRIKILCVTKKSLQLFWDYLNLP